jgi:gliotoxin/aspirochlorine biosynthesis aminotransferase
VEVDGFDFHLGQRSKVIPVPVHFGELLDVFRPLKVVQALRMALRRTNIPVKALLITNPHNPLGQCFPKDALEAVADFCHMKDLHLISDEVYALSYFASHGSNYRQVPFTSALSLRRGQDALAPSKLHIVWGLSKDLGCSSLRLVSHATLLTCSC